MKSFILLLGIYCFSILITTTTSKSSKCEEKLYKPQDIFIKPFSRIKRGLHNIHQFICTNVSADLVLDVNYVVKQGYRQELWIADSHIPKLPVNSSLSKFTHINVLRMSDVDLEELQPGAFSGLVQLLNLDLDGNKLTKIPNGVFNDLKTLETLSLTGNKIKEIEENCFKGLEKLSTLYLNENQLSAFSENLFSDLKNLQDLWISKNPLTQFSPSAFPNLASIFASNTDLKQIDVDFTKSPLNRIEFSKGKLEKVDFAKLPATPLVKFDDNYISEVKNWNEMNCTRVFLDYNQITSFNISENVEELSLSYNQIVTIGITLLDQTKKLRQLNLSHNNVSEITSDRFRGLGDLEILILDYNEIKTVQENTFANTPRLRKLHLSFNKIEIIAPNAFIGLTNLDHLDISGNNMRMIESPVLSELKRTNVVVGDTAIDWEYVKTLVNNSEDLSLQIDEKFWTCVYLNDSENLNKLKYITKSNVDQIKCQLREF